MPASTEKPLVNGVKPSTSEMRVQVTHSDRVVADLADNPITNGEQYEFSEDHQIAIVKITTRKLRVRVVQELDDVDDSFLEKMTIEAFLEYLTIERLRHMPHRGSRWDEVLKYAEYFSLQISAYGESVGPFVPESRNAAHLALANCYLLLELGPHQGRALTSAFAVFYQLGLSLSFLLRNRVLFQVNEHIRQELGNAYADLLTLVSDVAVYYRKRINHMSTHSVTLDFYALFGESINTFYRRKDHIAQSMWSYNLRKKNCNTEIDIRTIREWLEPRDQTLQTLLFDRLSLKSARVEYTCGWVQTHLLDFLRSENKILAITGPVGSGKTVLSGWIKQRLQRPLGRKSYETLSYTFEPDIPSETTSLALVKNLVMQLFERDVGDVELYRRVAKAYELSSRSEQRPRLESALWEALQAGFKTIASASINLVVLVDGLNHAAGGEPVEKAIFQRFQNLTSECPTIRAVLLSRSSASKASKPVRQLAITADFTRDDIRRMLQASLEENQCYVHQSKNDREEVLERLVHTANGSFLWAVLTLKTLMVEKSDKAFLQATGKPPKTVGDALNGVLNKLDLANTDTKRILSWLLVAERPLTTLELTDLLRVDLRGRALAERKRDIHEIITKTCGPLVATRNGIVRFRHDFIRHHLLAVAGQGKALMPLAEAQRDLTTRMLIYIKCCVDAPCEPSFDIPQHSAIGDMFSANHFLEYSVRYWTVHFRQSPMYSSEGGLHISADFKNYFPGSNYFAMIEWACWETQTSTLEALPMHNLSLRIRQEIFGEEHASVFQSLIVVGNINRKLSNLDEACTYFYRAARIGERIFAKYSTVITTCTTIFLTWSESFEYTTRTQICTYREEMLKLMIEVCKHQHGPTSDGVIRYKRMLAKLYIEIHEEHFATLIFKELYDITVKRYGKTSKEAIGISDELLVVLHRNPKHESLVEYTRSIFETREETMEITDIRRIRTTLQLANAYFSRGLYALAEEIYINLWRRIMEIRRSQRSIETHIAIIDIAIDYFRFLQRCSRQEEGCSVLICIWEEYQHEAYGSEVIILRLRTIGELMKSVGLLTIAMSIFTSVWTFFKSQGKFSHGGAVSITLLIAETVEEIITTTTTTSITTVTTTTTTVSEALVREVFEITVSRVKSIGVNVHIFKTCTALVTLYLLEKRWREAFEVITRTLELTWRGLVNGEGEIILPEHFRSEVILIAIRLAHCYHGQQNYEKAERIYLHIFRACWSSLRADDEQTTTISTILIKFYEGYHRHDKALEIYMELLARYRQLLGQTHTLTIKCLYKLGSLCVQYGRRDAWDYYLEIVTSLNGDSGICHHDAINAAVILSKWYYEEQRWEESRKMCEVLWGVFASGCITDELSEELIELLFVRYMRIVEYHTNVEYLFRYKLATQYRDICIKVFGASTSIVIRALLQLAQICEQDEGYQQEAITIYEEVISKTTITTTTTTTATLSTTTVTTARNRLTKLYVKIINSSSTTSKTTIQRAITLVRERYEVTRLQFGCWHESTLDALRELIFLYKKLDSAEIHATIVKLLQISVLEVITKETSSSRLHSSAIALASIYAAVGLVEHGEELLRQLQCIIVVKNTNFNKEFGLKLDHQVERLSYVFLVTFRETLRGTSSVCYSEMMADLLAETILYESLTQCIDQRADFETIVMHGARLRFFLATRQREYQLKLLDDQLYEIFITKWISSLKLQKTTTYAFYVCVFEELGKQRRGISISHAACIASNDAVKTLLHQGSFQEAYELAACAFHFIVSQRALYDSQNIGHGFKLSLSMACRGVGRSPDKKLSALMLKLSQDIIRHVLDACKLSEINFAQLKIEDLNSLVGLFGDQHNFEDLEWLLAQLWNSREVQKTWSQDTIISIGRSLVQARFSHGHHSSAIHLCEDISYNLRWARGYLNLATLDMYILLSSLYSSSDRHREAMGLHEEILRFTLSDDDDDGEENTKGCDRALTARKHLELLKRTYQRLGSWDKSPATYKELFVQLVQTFGADKLGIEPIEKWSNKGADAMGTYVAPKDWEIVNVKVGKRNPRRELIRLSSTWGVPCGWGLNNMSKEAVVY